MAENRRNLSRVGSNGRLRRSVAPPHRTGLADLIGFGFFKVAGADWQISAWALIFDFQKPSNSQT